jgi:cell wall assembly regulator SMI1
MGVAAAWGVIEKWLGTNAPAIRKSLRPPTDTAKVGKLQKKLGLTLPADFVASVLIHDGQKSAAEHGLFPDPSGDASEASYILLPLTDIGSAWAMMKELHDIGEFEGRKPRGKARGVEYMWWSPKWVPIADNGGGDFFCLDLGPTKGGKVGQVILFGHEGTAQRRVAWSFAEWMDKLAKRYKAGKISFEEDDDLNDE